MKGSKHQNLLKILSESTAKHAVKEKRKGQGRRLLGGWAGWGGGRRGGSARSNFWVLTTWRWSVVCVCTCELVFPVVHADVETVLDKCSMFTGAIFTQIACLLYIPRPTALQSVGGTNLLILEISQILLSGVSDAQVGVFPYMCSKWGKQPQHWDLCRQRTLFTPLLSLEQSAYWEMHFGSIAAKGR